jgi:integrase/recombinase XerD
MELVEKTMDGRKFLAFKDANISKVEGLPKLLSSFTRRVSISYSSSSTVKTYRRAVRDISLFHGCLPDVLETDHILDYLHHLKDKDLSWAKIKLDAAGLKYFYREMMQDEQLASTIPYPKEEKSLPLILSREELTRLFDAAANPKHRVILRLIYGSGLRRNELIHLRIRDIETQDGKYRIRINKSKGNKDRYTVLSRKVLAELRAYYKACRPKDYLFHGQKKGQLMSQELLRYIMTKALKRSGIEKEVTLHTLRHCGVYPDEYRGLSCP